MMQSHPQTLDLGCICLSFLTINYTATLIKIVEYVCNHQSPFYNLLAPLLVRTDKAIWLPNTCLWKNILKETQQNKPFQRFIDGR